MKIAVVGAGIAGLVCAYELKKAGAEVLLLEKEATVGGRMASRRSPHFSFDIGAQLVSKSYAQALEYCKELNVENPWLELHGVTHHLFYEGKLHLASYDSLMQFLRYSYLPPLTRLRLLLFISYLRFQARKIDFFNLATATQFDTQNAYDYALKWGGKKVADNVVDALVSGYHFHHGRDISLAAFMGCLNHFTRYFTFHHMVEDMNALPAALAAQLNLKTSSPVEKVVAQDEAVFLKTATEEFHFDAVVLATPGPVTKQIYRNPSKPQAALLRATRYASTINVSFRVPTAPILPFSLVVIPESENSAICSYFFPTKCEKNEGDQKPQTLVNIFLRSQFSKNLLRSTEEEIYAIVKREFLKVCPPLVPFAGEMIPHDLQRWPAAMPTFFPSYVSQVNHFWERGQGDQNVYFCGDFLNTPWIEGSIRCGQRVAGLIAKPLVLS